jgi:mono/diheme cytochrome c family protein
MSGENLKMRPLMLGILLSLPAAGVAVAADPGIGAPVTAQEKLGMRFFNQSCRACHSENLQGAPPYGPLLWSGSAGGNEVALRTIIAEGTARMPAWKYRFTSEEIAAITAYIETLRLKPELSKEFGLAAYLGNVDK